MAHSCHAERWLVSLQYKCVCKQLSWPVYILHLNLFGAPSTLYVLLAYTCIRSKHFKLSNGKNCWLKAQNKKSLREILNMDIGVYRISKDLYLVNSPFKQAHSWIKSVGRLHTSYARASIMQYAWNRFFSSCQFKPGPLREAAKSYFFMARLLRPYPPPSSLVDTFFF